MDEDQQEYEPPVRKATLADIFILAIANLGSFLDDTASILAAHSNWKLERERTVEEMRASIERIIE